MNIRFDRSCLPLAISACILLAARVSSAQLAPNQTDGFGNGRQVTFTYLQNFDCVDQPTLDLDFNGKLAQSDPKEMQTPICQPITEPTADPAGGNIKNTAHLYVLIPMFSVDNDQNPNHAMAYPDGGRPGELCGPALGAKLISLFALSGCDLSLSSLSVGRRARNMRIYHRLISVHASCVQNRSPEGCE